MMTSYFVSREESWQALGEGLHELGWLCSFDCARGIHPPGFSEDQHINAKLPVCLLRAALEWSRTDGAFAITPAGRSALMALVEYGMTLVDTWPRVWRVAIEELLGSRFYFSHQRNLAQTQPLASLASSRLGKNQTQFPHWPHWVDRALQNILRRHERLLLVAGTAGDSVVRQLAVRSKIDTVEVELPGEEAISAGTWIADILSEAVRRLAGEDAMDRECLNDHLWISPSQQFRCGATEAQPPLRDAVLFALADRVTVLRVRQHGRIEQLLQSRLSNQAFPAGSVYLALDLDHEGELEVRDRFLPAGAVGWYCFLEDRQLRGFSCHERKKSTYYSQQIACPLPTRLTSAAETDARPFLVHCTRGNSGPLPGESIEKYRDRLWLAGQVPEIHPLLTLLRIIRQRHLVADGSTTRACVPCISFSAVPLAQLLRRRRFQPHLQRWDWEPYGVIVRREALMDAGAKPVIYGSEADYLALDDDQKSMFQPALRQRASADEEHWASELEWRLLGDLWLDRLPCDSIRVFVRSEFEAQALSRESPWPVFWIES